MMSRRQGMRLVLLLVLAGVALVAGTGEVLRWFSPPPGQLPVPVADTPAGSAFPGAAAGDAGDVGEAEPFSQQLLSLCGDWGSQVDAAGFRQVLRNNPDQTARILHEASLKDEEALIRLWFSRGAFAHIFCGEPGERRLGGLHWAPRVFQAGQKGWIAPLSPTDCGATEIVPPVYTVGLLYRKPDGSMGRKCPLSYAAGVSASEMLGQISRVVAWLDRKQGPARLSCLLPVAGSSAEVLFRITLEQGELITAYPDASPSARARRCELP